MQLEGLTPRQKAIAELLWNTQTMEEVETLESILGSDVTIVKELMIAETLDEHNDVSESVKTLIDTLK